MSQAQMAQELDISPSYLNLLESNQRPVTVRVLLTLAERFAIDISELGLRKRYAALDRSDGGVFRPVLRRP